MGLNFKAQCFCDSGERGVDWGTYGEANATDCDSTGTVADEPQGIADLCGFDGVVGDAWVDGQFVGCGSRNAIYNVRPTTTTMVNITTNAYKRSLLDHQLELTNSRSLELRMVRVEGHESFGGGGTGLGAAMSLLGSSQCRVEHIEFVGNTKRGFGAPTATSTSSSLMPFCGLDLT